MSPDRASSERRKHRRARVRESFCSFAVLKLFMMSKPKPGTPQPIIDISQGGLGLASIEYIEPGKKVELELKFFEDKSIYKARGKVVYCKKIEQGDIWRTGIELTQKGEDLQRAIRFLSENFV